MLFKLQPNSIKNIVSECEDMEARRCDEAPFSANLATTNYIHQKRLTMKLLPAKIELARHQRKRNRKFKKILRRWNTSLYKYTKLTYKTRIYKPNKMVEISEYYIDTPRWYNMQVLNKLNNMRRTPDNKY